MQPECLKISIPFRVLYYKIKYCNKKIKVGGAENVCLLHKECS